MRWRPTVPDTKLHAVKQTRLHLVAIGFVTNFYSALISRPLQAGLGGLAVVPLRLLPVSLLCFHFYPSLSALFRPFTLSLRLRSQHLRSFASHIRRLSSVAVALLHSTTTHVPGTHNGLSSYTTKLLAIVHVPTRSFNRRYNNSLFVAHTGCHHHLCDPSRTYSLPIFVHLESISHQTTPNNPKAVAFHAAVVQPAHSNQLNPLRNPDPQCASPRSPSARQP